VHTTDKGARPVLGVDLMVMAAGVISNLASRACGEEGSSLDWFVNRMTDAVICLLLRDLRGVMIFVWTMEEASLRVHALVFQTHASISSVYRDVVTLHEILCEFDSVGQLWWRDGALS
jgi:hypothetical protein